MIRLLLFGIVLCAGLIAKGQVSVQGILSKHPVTSVELKGYVGAQVLVLDSGITDNQGRFQLNYPKEFKGMGLLTLNRSGSILLVLSGEHIQLSMWHISQPDSLHIIKGQENRLLGRYIKEQSVTAARSRGIQYLKKWYREDSLSSFAQSLKKESIQLQVKEEKFLSAVPSSFYLSFYLSHRKKLVERSADQKKRKKAVEHMSWFRSLRLDDPNLYHSGLLAETVIGHFQWVSLLHSDADSSFKHYKKETDYVLRRLSANVRLRN